MIFFSSLYFTLSSFQPNYQKQNISLCFSLVIKSRIFHLASAWLSISRTFQLILAWLSSSRTFSLLPGAGAGADSPPGESGVVIKEQKLWGHTRGAQGPAKQDMENPWIGYTLNTGFSWSSRKTAPKLLMSPAIERKCSRNWKKEFLVWIWAQGAHVGNHNTQLLLLCQPRFCLLCLSPGFPFRGTYSQLSLHFLGINIQAGAGCAAVLQVIHSRAVIFVTLFVCFSWKGGSSSC